MKPENSGDPWLWEGAHSANSSVSETGPASTLTLGEPGPTEGRAEDGLGGPPWVHLEYVGRTALVITGPYTGARYRFEEPGAQLRVDERDRHVMLSVPMLRAVETLGESGSPELAPA